MAIESGSYFVPLGTEGDRPKRLPPKPGHPSRLDINALLEAAINDPTVLDRTIKSGTEFIPIGKTANKRLPPKPLINRRVDIRSAAHDAMVTIATLRQIIADSVDPSGIITFNNWQFVEDGILAVANLRETYLYVNGVYVRTKDYTVTENGNDLIVEIINDLGYTLQSDWRATLIVRARVV